MDERDVRDDGSEEAVGVEEIEEAEGREAADEAGEEVASENAGVDLTVDLTGGGSGSVDLTDKGGILVQCRHLTRTVPDATTGRSRKILNDVSVDFRPGEVTAIIGPSGCGKSTLLKAICGIDQADAPRGGVRSGVFLNGRDYYGHIEDLSKRIAYLPQFDAEWLHDDLTVQQELEYVQRLRTTTRSKADRNRVSAINEELSNKHVYDQKVSTIRSLSGGEKKRVAIVGACLADPSLLLLDEPTAPLDPGTSASFVRDLVRDSRREGLTTIMVTHDPLALQGMGDDCHVVLMGKGGYLVFDGTFADLRERLMARYSSEAADLGAALQCLFASFAANDDLGFLDNAGDGEQGEGDTEVKWRTLPSIDPPGRLRQFGILLSREISLLRGNTSQLALLMFVPLLLGLLMTFIAGDGNLYADGPYTTLVATMFSLAAGSFFIGVFDSISAFSARVRIKNEELHGMRVGPYVTAVAVTMTLLCLVQTAILVLAFNAVVGVPSLDPLYGGFPDMFMSLFLCMHSAAMLGMLCSTVVRNTTYVAPLLVIVQIMFSKVLISLDGFADKISKVISLRWTMNSLAAITNINDFNPFNWNAAEYVSEKMTLFEGWTTLSLLSLAAFAACLFVMSMKRRALFHPDFLAMRKAGLVVARIKGFLTNRYVLIALLVAAVGFMLTQNVIALSAGGVLEQIGSTGSFVGEVASDAPGLAGEWAGDGAWGRDPEEREAYKEVRDRAQEAADAERKRQEEQAMRDMDPADRARLRQEMLGEMTPEERRQIIEEMTPEERREIAEQLTPEERREIAEEVAKESQGKGTPDPSSTFGGLLGGSR